MIEINADIGEGMPWDDELMELVTAVNVGLGEHAGKWEDSVRTLEKARSRGLRVGFHPGFPDRAGFGRREPADITEEEAWLESIWRQLDRATSVLAPDYIKPHGALYHATQSDNSFSRQLRAWLIANNIPLLGMSGSGHETLANMAHVAFLREGFCERGYRLGALIPRGETGDELHDLNEIVSQALQLRDQVDSICIHGDRPKCVEIARAVRDALAR